jgi:hypothetical protein
MVTLAVVTQALGVLAVALVLSVPVARRGRRGVAKLALSLALLHAALALVELPIDATWRLAWVRHGATALALLGVLGALRSLAPVERVLLGATAAVLAVLHALG